MMAHRGEKPHYCKDCKKTFTKRQALKNHMVIHTNERPFKCKQCHMSFKLAYSLKLHLKSHLKNVCKMCSKTFRQGSALRRHILYYKTKHKTIHMQETHKESEDDVQSRDDSPIDVALEEGELDGDLEDGEI